MLLSCHLHLFPAQRLTTILAAPPPPCRAASSLPRRLLLAAPPPPCRRRRVRGCTHGYPCVQEKRGKGKGILLLFPFLPSTQPISPARPDPRQRGQIRVSRPDPIRVAIRVRWVDPSQHGRIRVYVRFS
jgi:hypothetical protein